MKEASYVYDLTEDADLNTGSLTPEQLNLVIRQAASPGDPFRVDSDLHKFDGEALRRIDDEDGAESLDE